MIGYKQLNTKNFTNGRYLDMLNSDEFPRPTKDQVVNFQNLYQTLFSINPQANPQLFCENLNILIKEIGRFEKYFSSWNELHNYDFFRSIIYFLNADTIKIEVISIILSFLSILLKFKGPITTTLLETELIEYSVELYRNYPGDLTPQLLEVLTNVSTLDRRNTDPSAPYAEGLNRIFDIISIDDIYNIIFQSFQHSNNLNADKMHTNFSIFLYKITSYELLKPIQEFILKYIADKYSDGIINDYNYYIFILSQMSKYEKTFPIYFFYERELNKFTIDMISNEQDLDKFIYPALKCLIQILQIQLEPDFEVPEIKLSTKKRVFSIAYNKKNDSNEYYKEPTRIAAFKLLKTLLTIEFQKNENSLIKYLLNELIYFHGDQQDHEKLKAMTDYYYNLSYQLKYEFIDFLISFIDYGCDVLGNRFTELLITFDDANVLSIFNDALEIQDEKTEMLGIIGIEVLIKECKKYCEGMFEYAAFNVINIETFNEIMMNAKDEKLKLEASYLHSSLLHLPNRLFKQQTE